MTQAAVRITDDRRIDPTMVQRGEQLRDEPPNRHMTKPGVDAA